MDFITTLKNSFVLQYKIPDAEKRDTFIEQLSKAPKEKQKAFLEILNQAEQDIDQLNVNTLEALSHHKEEIKAIYYDSKQLIKTIEAEEDGDIEDILNEL